MEMTKGGGGHDVHSIEHLGPSTGFFRVCVQIYL